VVLPVDQQGLIDFVKGSGLSAAEVAGRKEVAIQPRVARWKYEFGKSPVPIELVPELPTKMRRLHDYYTLASASGTIMLGVRIKDEDYFHGEHAIWLNFEELYQLYHHDAFDISFINTWLL
jgi:hypothetical protein